MSDADEPTAPEADGQASASAAASDAQGRVDRLIRELQHGLAPEQAVYLIAVLATRSAAELHRLAKAQATATRGTPEWGTWAALQNGARRLVLDAAPAREGAAKLAGQPR